MSANEAYEDGYQHAKRGVTPSKAYELRRVTRDDMNAYNAWWDGFCAGWRDE